MMKTYWGVEVNIRLILLSTVAGGESLILHFHFFETQVGLSDKNLKCIQLQI